MELNRYDMATCRTVPNLLGADAVRTSRAHSGHRNHGWPHRPLPKILHRSVISRNHHSSHFPHSFTGCAVFGTLLSELYVTTFTFEE